MKYALIAAGMIRLVTSTSRLRKIWASSLRAMASMVESSLRRSCGGRSGAADGAEDVVQAGGTRFEAAQLDGVVLGPAQQRVQVLLQGEGLDHEDAVRRGRGQRGRG